LYVIFQIATIRLQIQFQYSRITFQSIPKCYQVDLAKLQVDFMKL